MLACTHPAFDGPMVLFQDVIKILNRSVLTALLQNAISFELNDGWWISSVLVGIDYPRCRMARSAQSFCEKTLSRGRVLLAERRKSRVAQVESTAR